MSIFACWVCELHLPYGSHICSVLYAKYVYGYTGSSHFMMAMVVET